jgi:hypothetical protein
MAFFASNCWLNQVFTWGGGTFLLREIINELRENIPVKPVNSVINFRKSYTTTTQICCGCVLLFSLINLS